MIFLFFIFYGTLISLAGTFCWQGMGFGQGMSDFVSFVSMCFLSWNDGLNFCVAEPQESR